MKYKSTSYPEDTNKTGLGLSSIYYWIAVLTFMSGTKHTQKVVLFLSHTSINRNTINFKKISHWGVGGGGVNISMKGEAE